MKFKRGDKIWCVKHALHQWTAYHIKCVIKDIDEVPPIEKDLWVEIIDINSSARGNKYWVCSKNFDFVSDNEINWQKRLKE